MSATPFTYFAGKVDLNAGLHVPTDWIVLGLDHLLNSCLKCFNVFGQSEVSITRMKEGTDSSMIQLMEMQER